MSSKAWCVANRDHLIAYRKAWYAANRDHVATYNKAWKLAHKERAAEHELKRRVKQYGLSIPEYRLMLLAQGGKCAICGLVTRLNVDHDHASGIVRGLICSACNLGLGKLGDTVERIQKVLDYLSAEPVVRIAS